MFTDVGTVEPNASLPAWPSTMSLPSPGSPTETRRPGTKQGDIVALVAVHEVVAVATEQRVAAVAAEDRVVADAASMVSAVSAAMLPTAEIVSSPSPPLMEKFSVVTSTPNVAVLVRLTCTAVPFAAITNVSAVSAPLTCVVSVPPLPRML